MEVSLRAINVPSSEPLTAEPLQMRNLLLRTVRRCGQNWREARKALRWMEQSVRSIPQADNAFRARMILLTQGIAFRERNGIDAESNLYVDVIRGELFFRASDAVADERVSVLYGANDTDSQKLSWNPTYVL